ncbi:MAG: RDD family protein [Cryobacterium sp.]|nr:RDD family protein [Cryobacterium sp.]
MPSTASSDPLDQRWPGERLGLPKEGSRSIGRFGRRLLALIIDWGLAVLVSLAFFDYDPWANLAIFAVAQILFLTLLSGSIGHLIVGLRVVPLEGGWIGWWRPLVRTLLLCLVIPAVIWDRDQRGLHDKAAGTILVRR